MSTHSLMRLLVDTLGQEAAMQSHWQYRCRTQPRVMERVLAEVKMLKQESRITKSPAAAAEDLWKRWSEQSLDVVERSA